MIEFLQSLVSTPSISGDEGAVVELCADAMRELGYDVEIDEFGNALGVVGEGPRRLLFDGHADTVAANPAWTRDPLDAAVQGGRLHGLGSTDMKGPLVALIHGVADAARNGRLRATVGVSITTLEEVMEGAALAPVLERFRPDAVVIAEPSDAKLALAQKGRAELLIEVKGRAAHAAFPEVGANALVGAAAVILALEERLTPTDAELGDGLLVVTEGASEPLPGISVVPALTRLRMDRRTLPGETATDVLEELRPYLERRHARRRIGPRLDQRRRGDHLHRRISPRSEISAGMASRPRPPVRRRGTGGLARGATGSFLHQRKPQRLFGHPDDHLRPGRSPRRSSGRRVSQPRGPRDRQARLHDAGHTRPSVRPDAFWMQLDISWIQ